jgi:hypothetical protein
MSDQPAPPRHGNISADLPVSRADQRCVVDFPYRDGIPPPVVMGRASAIRIDSSLLARSGPAGC